MVRVGGECNPVEPKYTKGQRVEILSVENEHFMAKYPGIESYVGELGTIVEFYWVGFEAPYVPRDYYIYSVRIDKDNNLVAVPEDALRQRFD